MFARENSRSILLDSTGKLIEAAIGKKHTCPDCKGRQARLRALPRIHIVDDHDRPGCVLRLAEINSPEKERQRFAFLRLMNKIMGED